MSGQQGAAPGWYPDPGNPGGLRWWNGSAWDAAATPSGWTRGAWAPGPREPSPEYRLTAWGAVMLFLATAAAVLTLAYGVIEAFSIEPTAGDIFRSWKTAGFRVAGGIGLVVCIAVGVTWLATRRGHPRFAVTACATALTVVTAAVLLAWGSYLSRSDPVPDERKVAAAFPVPSGWGPGHQEVIRPAPHTLDPDPPRVDRIIDVSAIYTNVCATVDDSMRRWGRPAYATPLNSAREAEITAPTGLACTMTGSSPNGWSLYVKVEARPSVIGPANFPGTALIPYGVSRVTIEAAPPGQ